MITDEQIEVMCCKFVTAGLQVADVNYEIQLFLRGIKEPFMWRMRAVLEAAESAPRPKVMMAPTRRIWGWAAGWAEPRLIWWGKDSHRRTGWCWGHDVEDIALCEPTHWTLPEWWP